MRKLMSVVFFGVLAFSVFTATVFAGKDEFLKDVVREEILETLPRDLVALRISVMPLGNDENSEVLNVIIAEMKGSGSYTLIERDRIDQILKEQNLQVSDLVDYETAVRIGALAGAEAIMFGEITDFKYFPGYSKLKMHLRVNSVESGEIIWVKNIISGKLSPVFKGIGLILLVIILIPIISILGKQLRLREVEELLGKEEDIRGALVIEIEKSQGNVQQAQNKLFEFSEKELAAKVKELALAIDSLKSDIKTAEFGVSGKLKKKDVQKARKLDKKILSKLMVLTGVTTKLRDSALSKSTMFMARNIRKTNLFVQELQNRFKNRKMFI
ncbi:MAG: hypothetical protein J7M11_01135 [Elusimicrobia bacterium]|nr:hypothetical protein [Elusimicrobiota bacterium]